MLLAALARPPVSLDTTGLSSSGFSPAEVERLTGWLLVRLLEEGYTVVPDPEQAQIELSIRAQAEGYVVTADGAEHRSFVLGAGPTGVVSMEILHRAIEAVDQEGREQAQPPDGAAVATALEVRGEADELLDKLLREQATLALSKAGRTLVPSSLPHDHVLCVVVDEGRILVGCSA
ncbi:MAG TPA: hypothetical protein VM686_00600, partial [Polyangiaceae bacterium]|nr:hypothetical protein [Polyangiaceae bacterium]